MIVDYVTVGAMETTLKFNMIGYRPKPLMIYAINNKIVVQKSIITQDEDLYLVQ